MGNLLDALRDHAAEHYRNGEPMPDTRNPADMWPGHAVTWPDEDWEATGEEPDPTARLTLWPYFQMTTVPMHVEAYAVIEVDGVQTAVHSWGEEALQAVELLTNPDGPLHTKTITFDGRAREYVIVAYPYCA